MLREGRPVRLVAAFVIAGVLLGTPAGFTAHAASEPYAPLTLSEVLGLLKGGVSPKRIAAIVEHRGVAFAVDDHVKEALSEAGADVELVVAVDRAALALERQKLELRTKQAETPSSRASREPTIEPSARAVSRPRPPASRIDEGTWSGTDEEGERWQLRFYPSGQFEYLHSGIGPVGGSWTRKGDEILAANGLAKNYVCEKGKTGCLSITVTVHGDTIGILGGYSDGLSLNFTARRTH
jgi:hypothetical protein